MAARCLKSVFLRIRFKIVWVFLQGSRNNMMIIILYHSLVIIINDFENIILIFLIFPSRNSYMKTSQ